MLLRSGHPRARRFETARLIGDRLGASKNDTWHPATELRTARQQFQRAFTAEFLCPVEGIQNLLQLDYSDDAIARAADHFDVSDIAVDRQVTNHLRADRSS